MPEDSLQHSEPASPRSAPWWRRLWQQLHSRFARQIALITVAVGAIAATGHFIGGMIGWWHAYEITFSGRGNATPASAPQPAHAAAAALSIAVLPFDNVGAAENGSLVENLTNDIAVELSRVPGSSVIGREAAARYRSREADPREVAKELGVRYVLNGGVERAGDKIRLRVRLLDGESGAQRWAERFDVERAALPGLVDELAARLARAVGLQMVRSEGQVAARLPPDRIQADDLAMRGWAVLYGGLNQATNRAALELFERAVQSDPRSTRGWGGVALASLNELRWGRSEVALRRLNEATEQLDRVDPNGYYAVLARALHAFGAGRDPEAALAAANRMVELYPGNNGGYQMRGVVLVRMGRFEEALAATEKAIALLPNNPDPANLWRRSFIFYAMGRYAEAAAEARQYVTKNPTGIVGAFTLAAALARDGRPDQARQVLDEARRHNPGLTTAKASELMLQGSGARFIAARDDMLAALREVGLP
jgi:TolB-like protein/Tfp pilus assembly protein PilF